MSPGKHSPAMYFMKIRKAVFTGAGFRYLFCPKLKRTQKAVLPIIDKPLIQCAAEMANAGGIDTLNFVTVRNTRTTEDHFGANNEFATMLRTNRKTDINRFEDASIAIIDEVII